MGEKSIIVVGDIFKNAADNQSIFTYSKALELIASGELSDQRILLKQGITEEQAHYMKANFHSLDVQSFFDAHHRCPNPLTHKVKSCNTLISEPVAYSENEYSGILMLDENCADLSDHVTGAHLQGMVLMEAARQFTTATLEKYFIDADAKVKLVMSDFQSQFHNYVFPFDVLINLKMVSIKGANDRNRHFNVEVTFHQQDKKVTEINRTVSMYDARLIGYKEKSAMKNAIEMLLNSNSLVNKEEEYERAA